MEQVKNFHIFVEGRVQGVGFRRFVERSAQSLSLRGWTRNMLDGRVEINVSGTSDNLEKFLLEVKRGPAFSHVREVICETLAETPAESLAKMASEEKSNTLNQSFEIWPDEEVKTK